MSRPRAGHAWTWETKNGRDIDLIANIHGEWIRSGCATGWPRCDRCRAPEQPEGMQRAEDGRTLCPSCFYFKRGLGGEWFWSRKTDYLFPYNIGSRLTQNEWKRNDPEGFAAYFAAHPEQHCPPLTPREGQQTE